MCCGGVVAVVSCAVECIRLLFLVGPFGHPLLQVVGAWFWRRLVVVIVVGGSCGCTFLSELWGERL